MYFLGENPLDFDDLIIDGGKSLGQNDVSLVDFQGLAVALTVKHDQFGVFEDSELLELVVGKEILCYQHLGLNVVEYHLFIGEQHQITHRSHDVTVSDLLQLLISLVGIGLHKALGFGVHHHLEVFVHEDEVSAGLGQEKVEEVSEVFALDEVELIEVLVLQEVPLEGEPVEILLLLVVDFDYLLELVLANGVHDGDSVLVLQDVLQELVELELPIPVHVYFFEELDEVLDEAQLALVEVEALHHHYQELLHGEGVVVHFEQTLYLRYVVLVQQLRESYKRTG